MILLSDGIDTLSVLDAPEVALTSRRTAAAVYWIDLRLSGRSGDNVISTWRSRESHRRERQALLNLVEESGGRVIPVRDPSELEGTFARILEELREQYVLGYYPIEDHDDGSWHEVEVRVAGSRLSPRTRAGYLDVP